MTDSEKLLKDNLPILLIVSFFIIVPATALFLSVFWYREHGYYEREKSMILKSLSVLT